MKILTTNRSLKTLILIAFIALSKFAVAQQFTTNGNTASLSCDCYRLTTASNGQFGSVWNNNLYNLNNSFDFSFDVFLGCSDGGADGMAFVLQPVSTSLGASGGGLGYQGISPSLDIEIDTYQNGGDPAADHIAIMQNGNTNHGSADNLAGPVQASAASGNVEDCAYHTFRIVWDAVTLNMDVYFDGVLRTSYTGDIVNSIFGGNPNVYWGFTAATGGSNNEHRFCLNIVPNFVTGAPNVCTGNPMQFTDASTSNLGGITQWTWNFGDGTPTSNIQNPIHTYTTAGNFNVTLTVNDISGCGSSQTFPVTVLQSPVLTGIADASVCPGNTIQVSVTPVTPGYLYAWTPAANILNANTAAADITVLATTNYTLTVTDPNGCQGIDNFTFTAFPTPVAAFTTADHCFGQPGNFIDNSSVPGGTIIDWTYQFGDGFGANSQNSTHIYAAAGNYNVTLQVQDNNGCFTTSAATSVTVYGLPSPSFTFTDECFGTPNTFTSTSQPVAGFPITITGWDFGDGVQVIGSPTTHTYAAPGAYPVTVGIQDQRGCQAGLQLTVSSFELPVADFSVANVCEGNQICPVDLSAITPPATIATYDWDWGDATPHGNLSNDCHNYAAAGTYTITLTITSDGGCSDVTTNTVTIYELPTANFTFTNVCDGQQMVFTNTSISNDGTIPLNSWTYGDGNVDPNQVDGANTYATNGPYAVTLDIQSQYNCTATITQNVTVFQSPTVGFALANDCENIAITFTDGTVVTPPTSITTYDWDWGDNTTHGNTASEPHTYTTDGTFTVTLAVTTSDGCIVSAANQITAYPEPNVAFTVPAVCEGNASLFTDASNITSTNIASWAWDFGGGNTSILQNPSYTFTYTPPTTNYPVTLAVTSNFGCVGSATNNAIINPLPTSLFTVSPIPACVGSQVTFTDASSAPAGVTITGWNYNTNNYQGLPIPSTHLFTPIASFTYTTSLNYNVFLTVTTDQGCTDISSVLVNISPIPVPDYTFDFVCEGTPTPLYDLSSVIIGTINAYSWDFGDSSPLSNLANPTHLYADAGTYYPVLTITSDANCTASITDTVVVNPNPEPNFTATEVCQGVPTLFTNTSTIASGAITNYTWNFGDATAPDFTQDPPSHLYATANTYTVSLSETSDSGCVASYSASYLVHPNPVMGFTYRYVFPDTCSPVSIEFSSSSFVPPPDNTPLPTIVYDYGDGGSDNNVQHIYTDSGTYDVLQTVTSSFGCVGTLLQQQIIWVYPVPTAAFSQSTNEVDLFDPNVEFTNLSLGESLYDWNFGDFSDHSLIPSPTHMFTDSGYFHILLTVRNQFGCFDTTSRSVSVKPFYALYIPSAFTVNEDTRNMYFTAVGEGVKEYEMWVYNRWGEEVFRSKSIENGWDGIVQSTGTDAPQAVYSYLVRSRDFKDKRHVYKGHVTLLR